MKAIIFVVSLMQTVVCVWGGGGGRCVCVCVCVCGGGGLRGKCHKTQIWKRGESRSGIEARSFCLPAYHLPARPNRLMSAVTMRATTFIAYNYTLLDVCGSAQNI